MRQLAAVKVWPSMLGTDPLAAPSVAPHWPAEARAVASSSTVLYMAPASRFRTDWEAADTDCIPLLQTVVMPLRRGKIVCKARRNVKANAGRHGGYWISELEINPARVPVRNCFRSEDIQTVNLTHLLAESDGIPANPPLLANGMMAGGGISLVSLIML